MILESLYAKADVTYPPIISILLVVSFAALAYFVPLLVYQQTFVGVNDSVSVCAVLEIVNEPCATSPPPPASSCFHFYQHILLLSVLVCDITISHFLQCQININTSA